MSERVTSSRTQSHLRLLISQAVPPPKARSSLLELCQQQANMVYLPGVLSFLSEMRFYRIGQDGLKFLTSGDLPTLASQSAGIIDMSHHAWPKKVFFLSRENYELMKKVCFVSVVYHKYCFIFQIQVLQKCPLLAGHRGLCLSSQHVEKLRTRPRKGEDLDPAETSSSSTKPSVKSRCLKLVGVALKNEVSLCHSGWSKMVPFRLSATSVSLVQTIVLPQPPEWLGYRHPSSCPANFYIFKTRFHYVGQAGPELWTSRDSPSSVSQRAGITGMSYCTQPRFSCEFIPTSLVGVSLLLPMPDCNGAILAHDKLHLLGSSDSPAPAS
ncbi:LOW QUALITY PROTEIN: Protein GVQW1 [Plecturocebus cupreus]